MTSTVFDEHLGPLAGTSATERAPDDIAVSTGASIVIAVAAALVIAVTAVVASLSVGQPEHRAAATESGVLTADAR